MSEVPLSVRDQILQSPLKLKSLGILIEELAKPVFDIAEISQYSSLVMSRLAQQNLAVIPKLYELMKKRHQPLVLQITKNSKSTNNTSLSASIQPKQKRQGGIRRPIKRQLEPSSSTSSLIPPPPKRPAKSIPLVPDGHFPPPVNVEQMKSSAVLANKISCPTPLTDPKFTEAQEPVHEEITSEEKQFEIIFSDSTQSTDPESDQHIIHSITETTSEQKRHVPDSFPLFQIVHTTGEELPEELQQEIVRLIKEANPKLDLNSITFKLKSPQTVEIIANVNS